MLGSGSRKSAEDVASVVAGALTSAVTGLSLADPTALAVGVPVGAALAQLLTCLAFEVFGRRAESYGSAFRRTARSLYETGDLDAELRRRAEQDPKFRQTVFATLKELEDSLDDAVVPALGVLAAEYAWPDPPRPVDPFFRGMLELLRTISAGELEALGAICACVAKLPVAPEQQVVELMEINPVPGDGPQLCWVRPTVSGESARVPTGLISNHHLQILHLLKAANLGRECAIGVWGSIAGPQSIVLPLDTATRMRSLLQAAVRD
jgi:hypothetical protein